MSCDMAGQAEGRVAQRGYPISRALDDVDHPDIKKVGDFAPRGELYGSQRATGILDLAETEPDDFDAALDAARAEGNHGNGAWRPSSNQ